MQCSLTLWLWRVFCIQRYPLEITIVLHFCMYSWWFLKFLVVSFLERLRNKVFSTKHQNFNKPAACSHQCPLRKEHRQWGISVPRYTFGSVIQARAIPTHFSGSAPRWLPQEQSPRRPWLQLYRKGVYFHNLWLKFQITAKRCDIWRNISI